MTISEFNIEYGRVDNILSRFAMSLTRDPEAAKDLQQETALKAYWNRAKFSVGTNFKAWAMTIMRNAYISQYRKKRVLTVEASAFDRDHGSHQPRTKSASADEKLNADDIQHMLTRLNPIYRRPFVMHYTGYRYDEIAAEMELPIGTVKSRIFFARKKLRSMVIAHGLR